MVDITKRLEEAVVSYCNKRQWTPTMTSVPGALGPRSVIPEMASGEWRNSERFAWEQDPPRRHFTWQHLFVGRKFDRVLG